MYEPLLISTILLQFIFVTASGNNTSALETTVVYNDSIPTSTLGTTIQPHVTLPSSTIRHTTRRHGTVLTIKGDIISFETTQTIQTPLDNRTTTVRYNHSLGELSNNGSNHFSINSATTTDPSETSGRGNTKPETNTVPLESQNDSTVSGNGVKKETVTTRSSTKNFHHLNSNISYTTIKPKMSTRRLTTVELTDESRDNLTDSGRLQYLYDEFDAGDKLWPVGMALTIGIPTIIVLAVTITVLYKRQVAKPRSRLSFYGQNYAKM